MCDNSIMPENINNLPLLAREVFPDGIRVELNSAKHLHTTPRSATRSDLMGRRNQ